MAIYDESFRQNIVILPVEKYLIRIVSTFILVGGFKPSKKLSVNRGDYSQ